MNKYDKIAQKIRLLLSTHPMSMSEISFMITNSRKTNHGYPSSSIRGRISEMKNRGLIEKTYGTFKLTDTGRRYRENETVENDRIKAKE